MDPNANLKEIRDLIDRYARQDHLGSDDVDRLIDLIASLDKWVSDGGFLPEAWIQNRWVNE